MCVSELDWPTPVLTIELTRYQGRNTLATSALAPSADIARPYRERSAAILHATSVTISASLTRVDDHAPTSSELTAARAAVSHASWSCGSAVRNAAGISLRSVSRRVSASPAAGNSLAGPVPRAS